MDAPTVETLRRASYLTTPSTQLVIRRSATQALRRFARLKLVFALTLAALVLADLACRFVIGLGDPPLYETDPTMQYLLQPSKTYYRFHGKFSVNRYSMRADDFPAQKSSPNELRVLVVGDSVVYGGVRVDQHEIATEILKRDLEKSLGRPIVVANASAKGWGPPSELAYVRKFGIFNADVVILELSSHDYADVPTLVPVVGISPDFPNKKPLFALTDLLQTYLLPRYFQVGAAQVSVDKGFTTKAGSESEISECRAAERAFFTFARNRGAKVVLVQHLTQPELTGAYQPGYYANQAVALEEHVPYVDDADELRDKSKRGENPFYPGDPIHLNQWGQPVLAHALRQAVNLALKAN